ncbi:hypothetical protein GHT06_010261 [Daphnia sinensis]|uniref:Ankyrin repeat domain-containing protein 54 n=1 Tax=Daphnia sinensis TaxID=1820382 RepID=A0AAD5KY50_9CRUS|nr:hypothetical protein GHT06_010261 [Daphnia sinensis]
MASTTVNGVDEFFQVVASGSVNDLCKILQKEGPEKSSKLAQSYNEKGETPLLVAIGKKQFPVMNMLVDLLGVNIGQVGHFTSNGVNYADCPPLFAAIVSDEVSCIDYLFKKRITRDRPSLDLNSFMSSSITCRQKANILMLFGATYMLSDSRRSFLHGLSYWKKAMTLSSSTTDAIKSQIPYKFSIPVFRFTDSTSEMMALEQIERMAKRETVLDRQFVLDQALDVSQRVLIDMQLFPTVFIITHFFSYSMAHSPLPHEFQSKTRDELERLSNLVIYILELLKLWWEKERPSSCIKEQDWHITGLAISHSWNFFESLRTAIPDYVLSFRDSMFAFDFVFQHLPRMYTKFWPEDKQLRPTNIDLMAELALNISVTIFGRLSQFSHEERQQFGQRVSDCVRLYGASGTDKPNLLLKACCLKYVSIQKVANYEKFVQLLLDAGEDPNATDKEGNTALHCLLAKNQVEYELTSPWDNPTSAGRSSTVSKNYVALTRLLLESGCHVDQRNKAGVTILELLKRNRKMQENFNTKPFDRYLKQVVDAVLPLTCYSAQVIRKHKRSTKDLPLALQLFVRRH